jgi:hypothetical protein
MFKPQITTCFSNLGKNLSQQQGKTKQKQMDLVLVGEWVLQINMDASIEKVFRHMSKDVKMDVHGTFQLFGRLPQSSDAIVLFVIPNRHGLICG